MGNSNKSYVVWLYGERIGVLRVHENFSRFILDKAYIENPHRSVLGLRFEDNLQAQPGANRRLPTWFSNLLPEGRLREWIARERGVHVTREVELLVQVGNDLPGAVQVSESNELLPDLSNSNLRDETKLDSFETKTWRFSLAGVALKFSMLKHAERFSAPAVGESGDWIVKLPDDVYSDVPINEYGMMSFARAVGIDVPEIKLLHRDQITGIPPRLWSSKEVMAYAIRRFDRTDGRARIHMEDLAQVRAFYPEDKFNGSFETIGALIYRGRDTASLVEFTKRLAFNILIGNGDAHLKNWSLLYKNPRVPTISPAYDLMSTSIYKPSQSPEDLGLKFGGSRRFEDVSLAHFRKLQEKLNVNDVDLEHEVTELVQRAQDNWPKIADLMKSAPSLQKGIQSNLSAMSKLLMRK